VNEMSRKYLLIGVIYLTALNKSQNKFKHQNKSQYKFGLEMEARRMKFS
jgi:hypothetical protein